MFWDCSGYLALGLVQAVDRFCRCEWWHIIPFVIVNCIYLASLVVLVAGCCNWHLLVVIIKLDAIYQFSKSALNTFNYFTEFWEVGIQMIHRYSTCGATVFDNNVSMTSFVRVLNGRKIHLTIRLRLATTLVICLSNFPLGSKMILRSLTLSFASVCFPWGVSKWNVVALLVYQSKVYQFKFMSVK